MQIDIYPVGFPGNQVLSVGGRFVKTHLLKFIVLAFLFLVFHLPVFASDDIPIASVSVMGPGTVCGPAQEVTYNAYVSGASCPVALTYTWMVLNASYTVVAGGSPSDNFIKLKFPSGGSAISVVASVNCSSLFIGSGSRPNISVFNTSPPTLSDLNRCGPGNVSLTVTPGTGNTTRWYDTWNSTTILSTSNTYSPYVSESRYFYASIVNTATGCESSRALLRVGILDQPSAPSVPSLTICGSGQVAITGSPIAGANTLKFYNVSTGALITTADSYTPAPFGASGSMYYTAYDVSALSENSCESDSKTRMTITVYPIPDASISSSASTICSGTPVSFTINNPNAVPSTTFSWTSSSSSGITGATSSGTSSSFSNTLVNTGNTNGNVVYTVTPSANGCAGPTATSTITIKPKPVASISPVSQYICSEESAYIEIQNSNAVAGTSFSWTVTQSSSVSGASSGASAAISQTLENNSTMLGSAIYSITPHANGCDGNVVTGYVTVRPRPNVSISGVSQVCSQSPTGLTLGSNIAGSSYSWTVTAPTAITGASSGSGPDTPIYLTNTTTLNAEVVYHVAATKDGCAGDSEDHTLTVMPRPALSVSPLTQTICSNSAAVVSLSSSSGLPGTTFTWTYTASSGILGASDGSGSQINQHLINPGASQGSVDYSVKVSSSNGCTRYVNAGVIIKASPKIITDISQEEICPNGQVVVAISDDHNLGTTFSWTAVSDSGITGAGPGSGSTIAQTLSSTRSSAGMTTYTITGHHDGCSGTQADVAVKIKPAPSASAPSKAVFSGQPADLNITSTVSPATFSWQPSSASNVVGGSAGSGTQINDVLSTSGSGDGLMTYAITPTANGCTGAVIYPAVTVYSLPVITAPQNFIVKGTPVDLNTTSPYDSYQWKKSAVNISTSPVFPAAEPGVYTVVVTKNGASVESASLELRTQFADLNMNYIVTNIVLIPAVTAESAVECLPIDQSCQSTDYFDGLGRIIQTVHTQATPDKTDLVAPVVYDQYNRIAFQYLPFADGTDGRYKPNEDVIHPTSGDYVGIAAGFYGSGSIAPSGGFPFSKTIFEPSPLNRIIELGSPGEAWQPDQTHSYSSEDRTIKKKYASNAEDEVMRFTVILSTTPGTPPQLQQNGHYLPNTLTKNFTKDEQHNEVIEFIDKAGRILLKKVQVSASAYAETYYVYDDFGNISFVLPPEAIKALEGN